MSVQEEVQNKSPAYHILAAVDPNQDEFIASDRMQLRAASQRPFSVTPLARTSTKPLLERQPLVQKRGMKAYQ